MVEAASELESESESDGEDEDSSMIYFLFLCCCTGFLILVSTKHVVLSWDSGAREFVAFRELVEALYRLFWATSVDTFRLTLTITSSCSSTFAFTSSTLCNRRADAEGGSVAVIEPVTPRETSSNVSFKLHAGPSSCSSTLIPEVVDVIPRGRFGTDAVSSEHVEIVAMVAGDREDASG